MALTITMNDGGFNVSNGINVAYCSTTTTGVFKFRYLLELTYNMTNQSGILPTTKTISFTQQQNQEGQAVFNLAEIYKSIVTPMNVAASNSDAPGGLSVPTQKSSIHFLPNQNAGNMLLYSWSILQDSVGYEALKGNANVMTLKFYEMFSTTADGIPVKQDGTGGTVDTLKTRTIFMLNGRGLESEGVQIDFSDYELTTFTKKLLSSNYNIDTSPIIPTSTIEIGKNEYHTLALLNRCAINTSAEPFQIYVRYYDELNAGGSNLNPGTPLIALNQAGSGGGYYSTAADGEDESFILHFGSGLENLQKLDTSEASYSGTLPDSVSGGRDAIKSYTIFVRDSVGGTKSLQYTFNIVSYCPQYEQSRLSYMNRFGVWEYITLNKEKKEELNVSREYVTKPLIVQNVGLSSFGDAYLNTAYPLDVAKQGKMTTTMTAKESFTLFTDYLKDYEIEQIKDMMMSPQIHLLDGDNAKALVLETANMKLKGEKNRGLYSYELKFNYASPKYRL
tara:strand:+ start:3479 stop:4993 length:1515 start_codon:yes stop_codon:yes gene_type:complete